MDSLQIYNQKGETVGTRALSAHVFGVVPKAALINEVVRIMRANRRQALSDTKTKAEVRGGGKKPWKQKGTGRARAGSIRSPLWRGGGIVFGPTSARNYKLKVNTKVKQLATRMVWSDKAEGRGLIVVESLAMDMPKTKEFAAMLNRLPLNKGRTLVLASSGQDVVKRAARNLKGVDVSSVLHVDMIALIAHANIVMTPEGIDIIEKRYSKA